MEGLPPRFPPNLTPPTSNLDSMSETRAILRNLLVILVVYFACLLIITYIYCTQRREAQPDNHQAGRDIRGNLTMLSGSRITRKVVQAEAAADTVVYGSQGKRLVNEDCVICLASFENGEECNVLRGCRHVYHKECIDEWIQRDGHCPLCRVYARVGRRVGQDLELGVLPFA